MAIILEGPDNSGKSTLAKAIAETYNLSIEHAGGPPRVGEDQQERCLKDLDMMQRFCIMDRSFIVSETVYGPIIRNSLGFDPRISFRKMQALDQHENTFLLVFCDSADHILTNMSTHIIKPFEDELHIRRVEQHKLRLIMAYRNLANSCNLFMNCIIVDPRLETENFLTKLPDLVTLK